MQWGLLAHRFKYIGQTISELLRLEVGREKVSIFGSLFSKVAVNYHYTNIVNANY